MSVVINDLRVHYRTLAGDVKALDGVTISIADGEIMGLAGESGCGKSTLGNSLIRIDGRMKHVGGSVFLDGTRLPIDDTGAMQDFRFKEVSIIPQYAMSALNPTRRIGKMISELVESRGVKFATIKPELDRRLELVGLNVDVLDRYPIELSGGMKQRTVMVLSTLLDPSLLIADEITSALDVTSQKAVARTLVQFRDKKFVRSMIVVTHDVSILYQITDTMAVMYAGKLAEKASTDVMMRDPRHPYTKLLIASLPEVGVRYTDNKLTGIPGTPPSLLNPPAGCRFRVRCPLAIDKCGEEPPFVEIEPGHSTACWRAGDVAAMPTTAEVFANRPPAWKPVLPEASVPAASDPPTLPSPETSAPSSAGVP
jgi:peptide/nickel transport system ATP-binding protein